MDSVLPLNRVSAPTLDAFDHESALEACARGERFALQALYEREGRWLLAVAQRIVRDRDQAHDVLHDAFLQIWQRAGTYQRHLGSGRGWIYTVVRHRALDQARKQQRDTFLGDELEPWLEQQAMLVSQAVPDRHDSRSLSRCMSLLDEAKRDCIVHAFIDGYTHEQIAVQLGAPVGTVKSWIRRGLLSLKDCLS